MKYSTKSDLRVIKAAYVQDRMKKLNLSREFTEFLAHRKVKSAAKDPNEMRDLLRKLNEREVVHHDIVSEVTDSEPRQRTAMGAFQPFLSGDNRSLLQRQISRGIQSLLQKHRPRDP